MVLDGCSSSAFQGVRAEQGGHSSSAPLGLALV